MKINAKDPDIATLYNRVQRGIIDLRPDFQRDMVWNRAKKQGLIDTILRDWKFPPVYLVVTSHGGSGEFLEVLDGQQRLSSIFDFLENKFSIDGAIEPYDEGISSLHGKFFSQLPDFILRRVSLMSFSLDSIRGSHLHLLRKGIHSSVQYVSR